MMMVCRRVERGNSLITKDIFMLFNPLLEVSVSSMTAFVLNQLFKRLDYYHSLRSSLAAIGPRMLWGWAEMDAEWKRLL